MEDVIPLIPKLPEELKLAAARGTLVPFVGASLSSIAGCPRWGQFADNVLEQCVASGALPASALERMKELSARLKLSLAQTAAKRNGSTVDYSAILHGVSDIAAHAAGIDAYAQLSALSRRFVTTNYDNWLHNSYPRSEGHTESETPLPSDAGRLQRTRLFRPEEMTIDRFSRPDTVMYLHGSLEDQPGMVVSTRNYIDRYAYDRDAGENGLLTFLQYLFLNKTVLFVGYGLDELEILEYVILKGLRKSRSAKETKHYLLQGFKTEEADLFDIWEAYFLEQCGVTLLPFNCDAGWGQLRNVLSAFADALPQNAADTVEDFRDMEGMVNG